MWGENWKHNGQDFYYEPVWQLGYIQCNTMFTYVRYIVHIIVLTNAALGSSVSRNARTNEAIDNISTATTILAWIGTAFVDICNISIET